MTVAVTVKKWGNSLGVTLPNEFVKQEHLHEDDKVYIHVVRVADLSSVFGSMKGKLKHTAQELKDFAREGWDDDDE